MELANGNIGSEAGYELKIEGKFLKVGLKYEGKMANANLGVDLKLVEVLNKIKESIPGTIDDAVINSIIAVIGE